VFRYGAVPFRELLQQRPDILQDLLLEQVKRVRSLTGQVARTHQRAISDPLTRLYNLAFFNERLGLELARARETGDCVSILMLDLDHFKHYNDTHGHQVGNDALVEVARLLKGVGRRGDIVARYGGEEFVLLLYAASKLEAWRFAEGIRKRVTAGSFLGAASQPLGSMTLSGGVATFPDDAEDPETLLVRADAHLYLAKMAGRNRIVSDPSQTAD
jgi:diguanylate cyclase (GGDEF)-like protein